jgi:hypothetical protein
MKIPRHLDPTALCKAQEAIHEARPTGEGALASAKGLRRFWPALLTLPQGNIRIRQLLTLAGLSIEYGDDERLSDMVEQAVRMLARATNRQRLPFIEGWSYFLYTSKAIEFLHKSFGPLSSLTAEIRAQEDLAALRALPTGEVADTDTSREDKVRPSTVEFFTCEAFTVWRRPGNFLLVWHDVRVRSWRWRFDLHVENTFGMQVRTAEDWPHWYTGWPNKKVSWRWRFWAPRMQVIERGPAGVKLRIGRKVVEIGP